MKKLLQSNKINLFLIIGIFVVVTIVSIVRGNTNGNAGSFNLSEDSLIIYGPEQYSFTIDLKKADKIELVSDFDFGTPKNGQTKNIYSYGIWQNSMLGEYNLCALSKVKTMITVKDTEENFYAFNFENAKTTESFYNSFLDYIEKNVPK